MFHTLEQFMHFAPTRRSLLRQIEQIVRTSDKICISEHTTPHHAPPHHTTSHTHHTTPQHTTPQKHTTLHVHSSEKVNHVGSFGTVVFGLSCTICTRCAHLGKCGSRFFTRDTASWSSNTTRGRLKEIRNHEHLAFE